METVLSQLMNSPSIQTPAAVKMTIPTSTKHVDAFEFLVKAKILLMSPKKNIAQATVSSKPLQTSNLTNAPIYLPGSVGGNNLTTPPSYAPSYAPSSALTSKPHKSSKKSRKPLAQKKASLS